MEQTKLEKPEVVGEVEMPSFDASKYIGMDTEIEECEMRKGSYGYFYLLSSKELDESGVRATRLLGTSKEYFEETGKVGWTSKSKTALYLKKMGVAGPEALVGKKVKVTTREGKDSDGNPMDFLTF